MPTMKTLTIGGTTYDLEGGVTSVNGQTGAVVLDAEDVGAATEQDIADAIIQVLPVDSASGAVASFPDGYPAPVEGLTAAITPVQSGSGTPAPDNVRPITGWSEAVVTRTGSNIFGGETFADTMVSAVGNTTLCNKGSDSDGDYVFLTAGSGMNEKVLFNKFKPNTVYTIVLAFRKSSTNKSANLKILYTDGTGTNINIGEDVTVGTIYTVVVTTGTSRTVKQIETMWGSATAYFYYDRCGVFEGAITADQFAPYTAQTVTIDLSGTRYGGTLDVLTGELAVTHVGFDGGDVTWNKEVTNFRTFRTSIKDPLAAYVTNRATILSSAYKSFSNNTASASEDYYVFCQNTAANPFAAVKDTSKADLTAAQFRTAMTGVQFVYELAEPFTVQLTPAQLETILGQNNIWANCGDVAVSYRADIQRYIEKKLS